MSGLLATGAGQHEHYGDDSGYRHRDCSGIRHDHTGIDDTDADGYGNDRDGYESGSSVDRGRRRDADSDVADTDDDDDDSQAVIRARYLALALLFAHCASMQPAVTEEQIKNLERQRQDAFVRGDVDFLDRQTAESYTTINGAGAMSARQQFMENLRAGTTKVTSYELSDLNARIFGNVAILQGIYRDSSSVRGRDRRVNVRFTRVFVNEHGTWRAVSYQQTPLPEAAASP